MDRARGARGAVVCLAVLLVACGDDDESTTPTLLDVPDTVAIGVLPAQAADAATLPTPPPPPTSAPTASSTLPLPDEPLAAPIGEHVSGNRILLIGDSVLASAAPRNEGLMCDALELFGWQAELDAEPGRDIAFALEVLDERMPRGGEVDWDAVLLSFGSDVDGADPDAVDEFHAALDEVIDRVSPRPALILTLADTGTDRDTINDMIRTLPQAHPNALVVEF